MHLIITRHGETEENLKGIYQGQGIQGTLSKKGIEQAKKLALRLKDERIDAIFSSDLKRAADTAKEIAKYHPDAVFVLTKELREVDISSLSGKNKKDFASHERPPGSETDEQIVQRVKAFFHEVYHNYADSRVLFVGHGFANRALYTVLTNKTYKDIRSFDKPDNTAVSVVDVSEDDHHVFKVMNCTEHLDRFSSD